MVKQFHLSPKDLDSEGIIRHEDLIGLRQIEIWYLELQERESKRQQAKARMTANKNR